MPDKLLLIPGPTPVLPRILDALAQPTVSHVSAEMAADLRESCDNLKKILFREDGEAFIVSGAGTLSMEMALLNTVSIPRDRVLVVSQGYFGSRMSQICQAFGITHDLVEAEWGKCVLPERLQAQLGGSKYDVVVCTHVDTSTGAMADVGSYARVVAKTGALFIVDGVCATGGIPERMMDWDIDVVLTAAQKCFGAPPGLAILVVSPRALAKRRRMDGIPAYYSDLLRWLPIMQDPTKYFSTPCVNEIRAFAEATRLILREGVEERFKSHDAIGRAFRGMLTALGFGLFTDPRFAAPTLSVPVYPPGVEDKAFRAALAANGVVVAGGLGDTAGRVFRVGHMGNLVREQIIWAADKFEKTLARFGRTFPRNAGIRAAEEALAR